MMCYRCYGKHWVQCDGSMVPCPECSGMGGLHCCDGLTEQTTCESSSQSTTTSETTSSPESSGKKQVIS